MFHAQVIKLNIKELTRAILSNSRNQHTIYHIVINTPKVPQPRSRQEPNP